MSLGRSRPNRSAGDLAVTAIQLVADTGEDQNLADDPAYAPVIEELMTHHARPLLTTPSARPHRSMFDQR
jgi:hypothetical protein